MKFLLANNYNSLATCDDGTCGSPTVYGCINPNALNYDPNATFDDGSCNFIKTYVPDDIFEAWCEGNGYGDGIAFNDSVSTTAMLSANSLQLQSKGITDLTGVEGFVNATHLYCSFNNLTVLDLSNNHNFLCQLFFGFEKNVKHIVAKL